MTKLHEIHRAIDARVQSVRDDHPDWQCSKGCDTCCRQLADIPRNTAALAEQKTRPVVCPMLDQASGACPVYAHRPVACRTYGFYVQRDRGMYCGDIETRVAAGSLADVVWGNHDAVDQQLSGQGESRLLTEWLERWARSD